MKCADCGATDATIYLTLEPRVIADPDRRSFQVCSVCYRQRQEEDTKPDIVPRYPKPKPDPKPKKPRLRRGPAHE